MYYQSFCCPVIKAFRPDKMATIFADDIFKCIFVNENSCIWIKILFDVIPWCSAHNNSALVLVVAWCQTGNKPLPEPMSAKIKDAIRHINLDITVPADALAINGAKPLPDTVLIKS